MKRYVFASVDTCIVLKDDALRSISVTQYVCKGSIAIKKSITCVV